MNKSKAIMKLRSMLGWSDRIGSDEVYEICEIINLLDENKIDINKTIENWRKI
tara:strand:+ start:329 stop:487 length:159 start_codon:yes stop_codon:yes gene_type:complete